MNSTGFDHANEGVAVKRLFVVHTAPSHPLSAPDPHLMLKLRSSESSGESHEDVEQSEDDPAEL